MTRWIFLVIVVLALAGCDGGDTGNDRNMPEDMDAFGEFLASADFWGFIPADDTPSPVPPPFYVRFTGSGRFESWDTDENRWDAGDYTEEAIGAREGRLTFTWDDDPGSWVLAVDMTFTSEFGGTFDWSLSEGGVELSAVSGRFQIEDGDTQEQAAGS